MEPNPTKYDFGDGNGPVAAHVHPNGGGWVADTARVEPTAFVGINAQVFGNARVLRYASVQEQARVHGNALVTDNAEINHSAEVHGYAIIRHNSYVFGSAVVTDNALVTGSATICGRAVARGRAFVHGTMRLSGEVILREPTTTITRSDGHAFGYYPCNDGVKRIVAGCRYFTLEKAWEHWRSTRSGTALGEETFAILRFFGGLEQNNGVRGWLRKLWS